LTIGGSANARSLPEDFEDLRCIHFAIVIFKLHCGWQFDVFCAAKPKISGIPLDDLDTPPSFSASSYVTS
jgi:hypothetical protein